MAPKLCQTTSCSPLIMFNYKVRDFTLGSRAWSPWQLQLSKKPFAPTPPTTTCPPLNNLPELSLQIPTHFLSLIPSQEGPAQI